MRAAMMKRRTWVRTVPICQRAPNKAVSTLRTSRSIAGITETDEQRDGWELWVAKFDAYSSHNDEHASSMREEETVPYGFSADPRA
jgi:hypothetical protein